MNKSARSLAIIAGSVIFVECVIVMYLIFRSQGLAKKLEAITPAYTQLSKEGQEFRDKYMNLLREYEAIKGERNDLLTQAKKLIADRNKTGEAEDSFKRAQSDAQRLEAEKLELRNQVQRLQNGLEKYREIYEELRASQSELSGEKERLEEELLKGKMDSFAQKASALQKENAALRQSLGQLSIVKQNEAKLKEQVFKFKRDIENLQKLLTELNKNYAQAVEKNRKLEQEVKGMPKKFAEISRQNRALMKETAQMHYNLGVFYTRNKEYERAINEFEKAVDIDPYDAYSYFNLGYIYAEYIVNRNKAIEYLRHYLTLAKSDDKDVEWVKKYLLTWETYEGKRPME